MSAVPVASRRLTQTATFFENLNGGLVRRLFMSYQRADPIPDFHHHEGEQIVVALEGESRIEVIRHPEEGEAARHTFVIRGGDVAVLAARKPHRWITPHGEIRVLAMDLCPAAAPARRQHPERAEFEELAGIVMGSGEPELLGGLLKDDAGFRELAESYLAEARLRRPGMKLRVGGLCLEMLVRIARRRLNRAPQAASGSAQGEATFLRMTPRHYVERAREFIHTDFRRALALGEVAERVGLSVTHLHRLFVAQTGLAPMAYLRRHRLQRGAELLAATGRSVAEIAREIGFSSPERFAKAFRAHFETSPRAFRQAALKTESAQV